MTKTLEQLEKLATACMASDLADVEERHRCAGARARQLESTGRIYHRGEEARALLDALELHEWHADNQQRPPLTTAELLLAAAIIAARANGDELELAPPTRVLVALEGGIIQGAVADRGGVELVKLDYDTEGADAEDLFDIPQTGGGTAEAFRSIEAADVDPAFIDGALAARPSDPLARLAALRRIVASITAEGDKTAWAAETRRELEALETWLAADGEALADAPRPDPLRHLEIADAE